MSDMSSFVTASSKPPLIDKYVDKHDCHFQEIAEDLLSLVFLYGTVYDNVNLQLTSTYFHQHITVYYNQITEYNHSLQLPIQHNHVFLHESFIKWLQKYLKNVRKLTINNAVSDDELQVILSNKSKLCYLDISPIKPHPLITFHIFSFIKNKDYCPNLKYINLIGCNIKIINQTQYEILKNILQAFCDKYPELTVQRIPTWFSGDRIIWECHAYGLIHAMPIGEIHKYYLNGIFEFSRSIQNTGMITSITHCKSDPKRNTIKKDYWMEDLGETCSYISRRWEIPENVVNEIESNDAVYNALNKLECDKLLKGKHIWIGVETIGRHRDPFEEWQDDIDTSVNSHAYHTYSMVLTHSKN